MAFTMKLDLTREIKVNSDYDTAFEIFSNVAKMGSFFPKVEKLEDIGDGAWKWTLEEAGISKYNLQVVYAAKYNFDKENGKVTWSPVEGIGNAKNWGDVDIRREGDKTAIRFHTDVELEIPFPSIVGSVIKPFVKSQFSGMLETFQKNVEASV
jgi:carbon monoxide dehydrogenase subunit G